jgi:hypothetical protein
VPAITDLACERIGAVLTVRDATGGSESGPGGAGERVPVRNMADHAPVMMWVH